MPSYNKTILAGHLTRDPELKYLPNNTPVVNFGLAVNRKYKDGNGEKQEEVTFVDCEAFAKPAEVINQYTQKGSALLVDGRLKLDQWQTQDGQNRSKLKVVVENFQFLSGNQSGQQSQQSAPQQNQSGGQAPVDDEPPF